ncbi:hypothetical protein ACGFYF_24750 [Streptomyces lavendulae]|uniref:hypothetical protein n=1 Tax=Streptomyces lavendulae TaxID=1914 RepID=UPI003719FABA
MGKSRRNVRAASLALLAVAPLLGGCATHSRQQVLDEEGDSTTAYLITDFGGPHVL